MQERAERLVDVAALPAGVAMRADERRAAVEAGALVRVAVGSGQAFARRGLDRARDKAALGQFADRLRNVVHTEPPATIYRDRREPTSPSAWSAPARPRSTAAGSPWPPARPAR